MPQAFQAKWYRMLNPWEWLKFGYENFGYKNPPLSAFLITLVFATVGFLVWWRLDISYRREHPNTLMADTGIAAQQPVADLGPSETVPRASDKKHPASDIEQDQPAEAAAPKTPDDNQGPDKSALANPTSEPVQADSLDRSVRIGDGATITNSPIVTGDNATVSTSIPEPEFSLRALELNRVNEDGLYVSTFEMEVITQVPIPNLRLVAFAPTVQSISTSAGRAGMFMYGPSGKRDGSAFTTPLNVYGKYVITVVTTRPEKLRFEANAY